MTAGADSQGYLDTAHLMGSLNIHAARGGIVTVAAQLARQAIGLATTMVMARILLPSDYGLVAMVTAVAGFVAMFRDMGLSTATVQRETVTQRQVSALFWINVAVGVLLCLGVIALAPFVTWLYGDPRLFGIALATAPGFLIGGFGVQHRALLQRQMRFSVLARVDVAALCVQSATGIALALAGLGYWALVLNILAAQAFQTAAVWVACRWRPDWMLRAAGVRSMLAFGGRLVGFNTLNYFARNLDNVLIGRVWGEYELGLYSRAYSILLLPIAAINTPIASVVVPALSRLQADPEEFRKLYLKVVSLIAFATMPIAALMIVAARDLIAIVLGPSWGEAGVVFQLLGISALIQPIYNTQGWLHTSLGRTDRLLRWGVVGSTLIILSFLIGLPFGAKGVALSYSIAIVLITWPCLWYAFRPTKISMEDLLRATVEPLVLSLLAALVGIALLSVMHLHSLLPRVVTISSSVSIAYILLHLALPSGRNRMRQLARWLRTCIAMGGA